MYVVINCDLIVAKLTKEGGESSWKTLIFQATVYTYLVQSVLITSTQDNPVLYPSKLHYRF